MSAEHIQTTCTGAVLTVTLTNEARRNSLSTAALERLDALADEIKGMGVRAVILTGAGEKAFTAGFNLAEVSDFQPEHMLKSYFGDVFEKWASLPVPVIGALNGPCMGGGVHVASICDTLVSVPGVRFMVPASRFGFVYQAGPVARIAAAFGQWRAARLLYLNQELTVEDLVPHGFVSAIVPPAELMAKAREIAEATANLAPLAVAGVKEIIREAPSPERALEVASKAAYSEDVKEGLAALRAKRTPVFKGA